jgi:hypothetical protein
MGGELSMLAITRILDCISRGNFQFSLHAQKQAVNRSIQVEDVINCAKMVTRVIFQDKKSTYKIEGYSLDNRKMAIVCAEFNGVIIVTVHYI